MKTFLSVETSTKIFSLAVSRQEKVLASRSIRLKGVLSSSIIPAIKGILKKTGISLKQLDGFAVGLGPGSFTSLRVGLSTIKGLAFSLDKPIVGISSLDILAMNAMPADYQICAIMDARRSLVYACFFEWKKGQLKKTSPYILTSIKDLSSRIKKDTLFLGDGVGLFQDEVILLSKNKKWSPVFAEGKKWNPQAKMLAKLAWDRLKNNKFDPIGSLKPLYLYRADCQVKR